MNSKLKLQRSEPVQSVPAPCAVRAGDYVFTSSIYPIDKSGHAITVDALLGRTGPTLIAVQTRHCLGHTRMFLEHSEVHLITFSRPTFISWIQQISMNLRLFGVSTSRWILQREPRSKSGRHSPYQEYALMLMWSLLLVIPS